MSKKVPESAKNLHIRADKYIVCAEHLFIAPLASHDGVTVRVCGFSEYPPQ